MKFASLFTVVSIAALAAGASTKNYKAVARVDNVSNAEILSFAPFIADLNLNSSMRARLPVQSEIRPADSSDTMPSSTFVSLFTQHPAEPTPFRPGFALRHCRVKLLCCH